MTQKTIIVATICCLLNSVGIAADFKSVFDSDAELTFAGQVSPVEANGASKITVNKGNVVLNGGSIHITRYMEITVADGASLTINSKISGGKDRPSKIDFRARETTERWPEALSGIAKKGKGRLVLAGENSYQGFTLADDGVLEIKTPASIAKPLIGGNQSRIILDFPVTQSFLEEYFTANACGDFQLLLV